jgi:anti-anti-sigma factor
MEPLKIFQVQGEGRTLIVIPQAESYGFRYTDVHLESNKLLQVMAGPDFDNLIVDFGALHYFGSEFIGALIRLARTTCDSGGRVALCNASDKMLQVLTNMRLNKLWPYFDTRAEALESVAAPPSRA